MALADSVPGVSGGTIAYLMGFFDNLVYSLNYLIKGSKEERIKAIKFLLKIGIGWLIGMALSVTILSKLFEKEIYKISSLFLGFIVASIPVMIYEEKDYIKGKYKNLIWMVLGLALVVTLSAFKFGGSINIEKLNIWMILYILVAGIVSISAMVLPGISGSTLLLIFGLYLPIITGIKDFLHFNFSSFWLLLIFGIGVLLGIYLSLKGIKKLLDCKRSVMVYLIIGMMIGSLYAIVVGPTTLSNPKPAMSFNNFSIIFFVIGALIVIAFQKIKSISLKKKSGNDEKN